MLPLRAGAVRSHHHEASKLQSIDPIGSGHRGWMRAPAAAAYCGLSTSTLAKLRLSGDGPPFHRAGRKVVLYDPADIDSWLANRRCMSTSDFGGRKG